MRISMLGKYWAVYVNDAPLMTFATFAAAREFIS